MKVFLSKEEYKELPDNVQYKYCAWNNDTMVLYENYKEMADQAKAIAAEAGVYDCSSSESKSDWDGNSYQTTVTDWFEVAKIIQHIYDKKEE